MIPCFRPDGTLMDLAAPVPSDIDWRGMAHALARTIRFNGGHPDRPSVSVAQHCVMGADALFAETGDALTAGFFVLHDGHEWRFGDFTTPAASLLAEIFAMTHGGSAFADAERARRAVLAAICDAKAMLDAAIFAAAGLPPPSAWPLDAQALVSDMDARMAAAEALEIWGKAAFCAMPGSRLPAPRLARRLAPWGAEKAAEEWLARLARYCGVEPAR